MRRLTVAAKRTPAKAMAPDASGEAQKTTVADLRPEARQFIIERLMVLAAPTAIAADIAARFGANIDPDQLRKLDPSELCPTRDEFRRLHDDALRLVREHLGSLRPSDKTARLAYLDRLCRRAEAAGNLFLASVALELAALEGDRPATDSPRHGLRKKRAAKRKTPPAPHDLGCSHGVRLGVSEIPAIPTETASRGMGFGSALGTKNRPNSSRGAPRDVGCDDRTGKKDRRP
jgi:hypothetical protein